MFESDDFDQVLSQFDFSENAAVKSSEVDNGSDNKLAAHFLQTTKQSFQISENNVEIVSSVVPMYNSKILDKQVLNENKINADSVLSPKHTKRKIINSYFDHKSKRKFPGPAGLLSGGLEENTDETICRMELLSQDVDFSQNNLRGDLFESPLWSRLMDDLKNWNLSGVDSIKTIKQHALTGNLRRRKAHLVTVFVETVDRSATDPLIMMRDTTGSIKGTLHRDAWTTFSQYIASEYCALILSRPTVLTTGSAYKKHYLNITLSNILAIYSSAVLTDKSIPEGYVVVHEDEFTVIKNEHSQNIGHTFPLDSATDNGAIDLLQGLDDAFCDEVF